MIGDIIICWLVIIVLLSFIYITYFLIEKYWYTFNAFNEKMYKIFKDENLVYLNSNIFAYDVNFSDFNKYRNAYKKFNSEIVEVKDLPKEHLVFGQKGVFAKRKIKQFDIIGEYTGKITNKYKNTNKYLSDLFNIDKKNEEKHLSELLKFNYVIDAEKYGNEFRYINSNINISPFPNVQFTDAIIDNYPRVLILAIKDIEIGEELLTQYDDDYFKHFPVEKNLVK